MASKSYESTRVAAVASEPVLVVLCPLGHHEEFPVANRIIKSQHVRDGALKNEKKSSVL
jgi:hypothetical protein